MVENGSISCECDNVKPVVSQNGGEMVCARCGSVLQMENVDPGPEWRAYNPEHRERRRRIGSPLTLLQSDLGVNTSFNSSSDLAKLGSKKKKVKRLAKLQSRTETPLKRRMERVLRIIKRAGEKLGLARHELETAAQLARKTIILTQEKRWNRRALTGASIYMACRLGENPKKIEEVVACLDQDKVSESDIVKATRIMNNKMDLQLPAVEETRVLRSINRRLKLKREILMASTEIIKASEKARVGMGKDPGSVAAASVYLAHQLLGEDITQKEVCQASKTTEVTLRSRVKDILERLSIDITL